ncbi:MAG TPA: hypothetical protein VFJ53_08355 [Solirubrobacterales bacterium]|nr:hypothetical protein [Solirubrobacterales bacterium]
MGGPPGRVTVAAAVLALVLALAAAALARSGPRLAEHRPLDVGASAGGALEIADSRGEAAILRAPALRPGGSVVGSLAITNLGAAARLELSRVHLVNTPGAGGASLGAALRLNIREIAVGSQPLVYSGLLTAMPTLHLGLLPAGAERRYRFVARLPEPGFVDNGLMGSRLRFDYRWRLRGQ